MSKAKEWSSFKYKFWNRDSEGAMAWENNQNNLVFSVENRYIKSLLDDKKATYLDLACGLGRMTPILQSKNKESVACDFGVGMLEKTRERYGVQCVRADAFHLPFRDNVFDGTLIIRFIYHFPPSELLFEELSRVNKKHSVIIFNTLNKYSLTYFTSKILRLKVWASSRSEVLSLLSFGEYSCECKQMFLLSTCFYRVIPKLIFSFLEKIPLRKCLTYWRIKLA